LPTFHGATGAWVSRRLFWPFLLLIRSSLYHCVTLRFALVSESTGPVL
jgi:hypothetical protein